MDFYNNLSSNGIFFFWIVVFLVVILFGLLIILFIKNKKLTKLLVANVVSEKEEVKEDSVISDDNIVIDITNKIEDVKEEEIVNDVKEEKIDNGLYKKNVLREISKNMTTSPISVNNNNNKVVKEEYDLKGIDYGEDSVSPLEMMEDTYQDNDNMKFASEIVDRMEKEIKPSNIELTDYEKKQEEEAIISYDELVKVKDKIYNITEDEEDEEFIDELKNFRLDLE